MLCQKCHKNNANIHLTLNLNGQQVEYTLCNDCYKQERANFDSSVKNMFNEPFSNMFGGFADAFGGQETNGQKGVKTKTMQHSRGGGGFLDQFGKNLTDEAREGKLDPVIGRDKEIEQVIEILN